MPKRIPVKREESNFRVGIQFFDMIAGGTKNAQFH
jgi:hypothetical protein